jgi:glucose-1-phosphate adenylyltransferase
VPFGGRYRIIDFALSNFVNSGYRHVYVLTQYMASSLIHHLARNWHLQAFGMFIEAVPAQMRLGERWFVGTADAVWQNMNLIRDAHCRHVAVFGGDHIYRFDARQMERAHIEREADLTIAAYPVPVGEASRFGVIEVADDGRIVGFAEKPEVPREMPDRPGWSLVSMGNYVFRTPVLEEALREDAARPDSSHDFGKDVIPSLLAAGRKLYVYDFNDNLIPGEQEETRPYWRDVGTIDSYFEANMDLRAVLPEFNLYNRRWPIRSAQRNFPPAKFVRWGAMEPGEVVDSLVCEGTIVCSATLEHSIAGYDCRFDRGARVERSVILSGCTVGRGAHLRGVLMEKNCRVEAGVTIGLDPAADRARFPFVSERGVVVLPKGTLVRRQGPIEIAWDLLPLLENDPATRARMAETRGLWERGERSRHSHDSSV